MSTVHRSLISIIQFDVSDKFRFVSKLLKLKVFSNQTVNKKNAKLMNPIFSNGISAADNIICIGYEVIYSDFSIRLG